jgi:hypothetical protein
MENVRRVYQNSGRGKSANLWKKFVCFYRKVIIEWMEGRGDRIGYWSGGFMWWMRFLSKSAELPFEGENKVTIGRWPS